MFLYKKRKAGDKRYVSNRY